MAIPFQTRKVVERHVPDAAAEGIAAVASARVDRQAFARLYGCYGEPVYRYCLGRLRSHEAAEDAAAQVFAKALAGLPDYRGDEGDFRSWLFTIAYRTIADHFRTDRADCPLEEAADLVDGAPSVEDLIVAAEERRSVDALLARLPADQRRVVELRIAGLTGGEIAAVLGRSPAAVKMLQFRAVTALRALREADAAQHEVHHVSG